MQAIELRPVYLSRYVCSDRDADTGMWNVQESYHLTTDTTVYYEVIARFRDRDDADAYVVSRDQKHPCIGPSRFVKRT